MKRNANEKYSGRQGDAADDGRGGEAGKNADLAAGGVENLPQCRLVRAQVFPKH